MIGNRVLYVLLLVAMILFYIFTNSYFALLLAGLFVVLPIISIGFMLASFKGAELSIDAPDSSEKENVEIGLKVENKSFFPIACISADINIFNSMTGATLKRTIAITVGGRKNEELKLELKNSKVGTLVVSCERIRIFDLFRLFSFSKPAVREKYITVFPKMEALDILMQPPVETTGESERFSPDKDGNDISELFALREYIEGDEVRKIHWKLSSKMDQTIIRQFSRPLNYSIFLLAELKRGDEDLVDVQIETYFSISKALLERGINHSLAWFDAGAGNFHIRAMDNFEDLDMACAAMLACYSSDEGNPALEYYRAGAYMNAENILIYVTQDPDRNLIDEIKTFQNMTTYVVRRDEKNMAKAEILY